MNNFFQNPLPRRSLLSGGVALAGGTAIAALDGSNTAQAAEHTVTGGDSTQIGQLGEMITIGDVGRDINLFDPTEILTDWDTGTVTTDDTGNRVREFEIFAEDRDIEIAPGILFPAWTYNGRVPGPTIRATEGDLLRINFQNNGSHPHSIHFHGIHAASMDGLSGSGLIGPGESFAYEFTAKPFGCHLYHCHAFPLRAHMHKGMYGAFIVDPDPSLHPADRDIALSRQLGTPENAQWQELVMVMNAFDTNFDGGNEFYMVNTVAHHFMKHPIKIDKSRPVRIYLINATEFDPINSLHLHANFFDYFDHGTTLTPTLKTVDTIMQCQAQRGILEFTFAEHPPGQYMFHAHQSEFAELGWMSLFDVT